MLSMPAVCAAQQQAPTATPSATAAKAPAMSDDAKQAKSKACSAEADAKKLHGKERKEFRSKCKRGG
ncbi:MAG: PsiF family protein [Methylocella sp.]